MSFREEYVIESKELRLPIACGTHHGCVGAEGNGRSLGCARDDKVEIGGA